MLVPTVQSTHDCIEVLVWEHFPTWGVCPAANLEVLAFHLFQAVTEEDTHDSLKGSELDWFGHVNV